MIITKLLKSTDIKIAVLRKGQLDLKDSLKEKYKEMRVQLYISGYKRTDGVLVPQMNLFHHIDNFCLGINQITYLMIV